MGNSKKMIIFIITGLLGLAILAEAGLRIFRPQNAEDQKRNLYDLPYPHTQDSLNPFANGILPKKAWDARGKAIPLEKPPDTTRIVFLGNSVTYGYGLETQSSFPYLVQQTLDKKYGKEKIEAINAGYPGTGFYQQLIFFRQVLLPAKPDLVFLCTDSGMRPELIQFRQERKTNMYATGLLDQSAAYRFFKGLITSNQSKTFVELVRLRPGIFPETLPGKYFLQDLSAMYNASQSNGFDLALLIAPNRSLLEHLKKQGIRPEDSGYQQAMHQLSIYKDSIVFAKEKNLPALDLVAPFLSEEDSPDLMIDDGHMGPKGNEIFAKVVSDFFMKQAE